VTAVNGGFDRVQRRSLPEAVAEQLSRRLKAGEFEVGQQLPGHRQLAAAFGVSVPVVREALSRLVAQGLLQIHAGQGTFVRAIDRPEGTPGNFEILAQSREELLEILEARVMLETELGALAAERADAQQVATLSRLVEQMAEAGEDSERFLEADLAFHLALAEAARNGVLLRVMLGLRTSIRRFLDVRSVKTTATQESVALAVEAHWAIVTALSAGDPVAARQAVRTLMDRAARDMSALDEATQPDE
jgi:GntR family transcriptional regulator, transcriptional repressor for pyruvate dehydrogenase complex